MKSKSVNLRDIADHAGVSTGTVSLALRDDPRISKTTKEKVFRVAEKLGYRPNPIVSALMSKVQSGGRVTRHSKLGFFAPYGNFEHVKRDSYVYPKSLIETMRTRARELGYEGIDSFELEPGATDFRHLSSVVSNRGIRGVLLPPFYGESIRHHYQLQFSDFAVVALGYSQQVPGIHRVAHDQYQIAFRLTKNVLDRGYRRIGLSLNEAFERRTGWHFTGGYLGAIQRCHSAWQSREGVLYRDEISEREDFRSQFLEWVEKNALDCVIAQSPYDYTMLNESGRRVPEDIGFAYLSVRDQSERGDIEPCGMFHDPVEVGRAAVDLLTAQISRNEFGLPPFPKTILTRPKFVEGKTLKEKVE